MFVDKLMLFNKTVNGVNNNNNNNNNYNTNLHSHKTRVVNLTFKGTTSLYNRFSRLNLFIRRNNVLDGTVWYIIIQHDFCQCVIPIHRKAKTNFERKRNELMTELPRMSKSSIIWEILVRKELSVEYRLPSKLQNNIDCRCT